MDQPRLRPEGAGDSVHPGAQHGQFAFEGLGLGGELHERRAGLSEARLQAGDLRLRALALAVEERLKRRQGGAFVLHRGAGLDVLRVEVTGQNDGIGLDGYAIDIKLKSDTVIGYSIV